MPERAKALFRRSPLHPQWLIASDRRHMEAAMGQAKGRVLDIGCADRWVERHLPAGCDYIGLDSVQTGQGIYKSKPTVFGDAANLPVADGSIDTVLMFEVLEHLSRPEDSMREVCRVLRAEGLFLASVPFLYPIHDAPHDYQRYTEHGLARITAAAGLAIVSIAPRLDSLSSAALLANLAIGGSAQRSLSSPGPRLMLLPFLLVGIVVINLMAALLRPAMSNWRAMTNGYVLVARKGALPMPQGSGQ